MSLSPTASFTFNIYPAQMGQGQQMGSFPTSGMPIAMPPGMMGQPLPAQAAPFNPMMVPMQPMPSMGAFPGMAPAPGGDFFGRSPMGFYPSMSPYAPPMPNPLMAWTTPFLSPFQQLQDLYFQTVNGWLRARAAWGEAERAKMMAEQEQTGAELLKRDYMTLGQQLEAEAKTRLQEVKHQPAPAPFNQAINFPPPQLPAALPMEAPPVLPPVKFPVPAPDRNTAPVPLPLQSLPPAHPPLTQPIPPQAMPPIEVPPVAPAMAPPQVLFDILTQPTTAQTYELKQQALQQIGSQGPGNVTPEILEGIKRLVLEPMPEALAATVGVAKPEAEALREQGLWALGLLGGSYPKTFDTNALPGLGIMEQVLSNPKESPAIRAAAIQGLRAINRPGDPRILADMAKAEEVAQHDASSEVRDQVAKARSGLPLLPQ